MSTDMEVSKEVSNKISFITSDDVVIEVPVEVGKNISGTIKDMIEDAHDSTENPSIPLPTVHSNTLKHIFEFYSHYTEDVPKVNYIDYVMDFGMKKWNKFDLDYCMRKTNAELFAILNACDFLAIKNLKNVCAFFVACKIKKLECDGKTCDQIKEFIDTNQLNTVPVLTDEELRKLN